MAQETDETKAGILPDPELNPLLNPLLAAHMGRWAEVYFTSPPDKRGRAVAELLRELEKTSKPEPLSTPRNDEELIQRKVEDHSEEVLLPSSFAAAEERDLLCGSCGHSNSAQQRFCGMCGTPLGISETNPRRGAEALEAMAAASWSEPELPLEDKPSAHEVAFAADSAPGFECPHAPENLRWPLPEENSADFGILAEYPPEPVPHSYRIYAGAVLAILLTLLVYMAWRGNAAFSSNRTVPSVLPQPVPSLHPEARPAPPAAAPANPKANAAPSAAPAPSPQQTRTSPAASSRNNRTAEARAVPKAVSVTAGSFALAAEGNGSEELATAEKYLNAGPGTRRDSQQAATWLWRAVSKQNLTATMLLSDLYLRGDGVPKSCDQARLLLDAAARKGGAAAAERIRHLQAFGCP